MSIRIRNLLIIGLISVAALGLGGCADTSFSGHIPDNGPSMTRVYSQAMHESEGKRLVQIRREVNGIALSAGQKQNVVRPLQILSYKRNFKLIPNPEVQMYVYAHLAGKAQVPIPGYKTQFPMFNRVHYALASEIGGDK